MSQHLGRRKFLASTSAALAAANMHTESITQSDNDKNGLVFLARVPYDVPSGRHLFHVNEDSWLSYFQKIWHKGLTAKQALGINSYGINPLFDAMKKHRPPKTEEQLRSFIEKNCYNWGVKTENGMFEFLSDDDELDMSYHFLNSSFASKNQELLKFPLHQGWLPREVRPQKQSKPKTWVVSRMPSSSGDSNLWDIFEVDGVRLDQIGKIHSVIKNSDASFDSEDLERFLKDEPKKQNWNVTLIKFLNKSATFDGNRSEFQCSPHLCEVFHHCDDWGKKRVFQQLIVFDDLWAATNEKLFKSFRTLRKNTILFP